MAREIVRLDAAQRGKRDGILPPADQSRGRTGHADRDLTAPIVVTALFGAGDQAWFEALRRAHYPPARNQVSAHLTLFHHLPPSIEAEVRQRLAAETRHVAPPAATLREPYSLGRGVAWRIESEGLAAIRARLAEEDAAVVGFDAVVVKVQRPGIQAIVDVDLAALRRVAGWLSRVRIVSDHVNLPILVQEFAETSLAEIDYLQEAANAERFADDVADDARVDVPDIVWERTTRRVLTLSDVTAIKVNDVEALRAAGIDPSAVAAAFAQAMFEQLFGRGFFHADPHPGNIFVTPSAAASDGGADDGAPPWRLTFIDFGMMGQVPDGLRDGLRRLLIAVASRDGTGLVAAIRDVGVLLPSAETTELERAMTQLFARFGGMGFAQLRDVDPNEFRQFGEQFGEVVRSLPFQLPENFLLVIRAMSLTSGVCSALDPEFNIWDAVEPYAGRLMREQSGNLVQDLAQRAVSIAGLALGMPQRVDALATRVEEGRVSVTTPALDRRLARLERTGRRIVSAVLFAALFVGGILVLPANGVIGTVLLIASALPLLHALFAGIAGRRGPG
ncbi:MAG: AarF/ABC1/UbiB kinase family protein [Microbacterium sp.]|nr:AarF/ABC1/UbiB kinase family protein [Microbacterium sp.]